MIAEVFNACSFLQLWGIDLEASTTKDSRSSIRGCNSVMMELVSVKVFLLNRLRAAKLAPRELVELLAMVERIPS